LRKNVRDETDKKDAEDFHFIPFSKLENYDSELFFFRLINSRIVNVNIVITNR